MRGLIWTQCFLHLQPSLSISCTPLHTFHTCSCSILLALSLSLSISLFSLCLYTSLSLSAPLSASLVFCSLSLSLSHICVNAPHRQGLVHLTTSMVLTLQGFHHWWHFMRVRTDLRKWRLVHKVRSPTVSATRPREMRIPFNICIWLHDRSPTCHWQT